MIYRLKIERMPDVTKLYRVVRRTVWQIADDDNILIYVSDGKCEIECGGRKHIFSAGETCFVPAFSSYTRRPVGKELCTMYYIHFRTEKEPAEMTEQNAADEINSLREKLFGDMCLSGSIPSDFKNVYISEHIEIGKKQLTAFEEIMEAFGENSLNGRLLTSSLLCRILILLSEATISKELHNCEPTLSEHIPEKLRSAVLYIRSNCTEKITLSSMCQSCGISKQQMIRYFNDSFGTTPTAYITSYKIDKAKEMFMNSPLMTVKEVSSYLGFDDQCYFSRLFGKVTGESPTEYKRRIQTFDEKKHISDSIAEMKG